MESVLISIVPGIAFSCTLFLVMVGLIQLRIYSKKGYKRSRAISLFSFMAAIFACEHFLAQSRAFPEEFTHGFVWFSTVALCLSMLFYLNSLRFFLAIPNFLYRGYMICVGLLSVSASVGLIASLITGVSWFFDSQNLFATENYFVNSYTIRFGTPTDFLNNILSLSSVVTALTALYLMRRVWRSSRDLFFMIGLLFSVVAVSLENFLLPFTLAYFFPVIYMANVFEAFRMNTLSYREFVREQLLESQKEPPKGAPAVDQDKYQNSNLTDERIQQLANHLLKVLREEKLYLNPNLSSEALAKKIGIPPYQLSQVVNIGLNITFFELLSQHRIDEVKRRLKDERYSDETIINIAYDSRFNSKSTFNTAFKKQTGMTPSVFRKQA